MILGLLGYPVAHSRSPAMHAAWIRDAGLDAVYLPFEVDPDTSGDQLLSAIRTLGLKGVNLTVPFKERVLAGLDVVDERARRVGAVNTVIRREGLLHGTNTDAPGFVAGLREVDPALDCVRGRTAVILGAGGAGRAVAAGLREAGAARIVILNRTLARAEAVCAALNATEPDDPFVPDALDRFDVHAPDASVFAVAVSGPGQPAIAALDPHAVPEHAVWVDLNYWSDAPPLVRELDSRGVRVQDGLPMLIHQGALAFEAFTGRPADRQSARIALADAT